MKLLYEEDNQSHSHRYFQCETMEEYEKTLAECKADAKASEFKSPWGHGRIMQSRPVNEGKVVCNPYTMVMDGYASHGGRKIRADGFSKTKQDGDLGNGYSIVDYYIKPNCCKENRAADRKEWWV